jgi:hypothetical protein
MKELLIEEKAKRYDEALKVLHKYDGANIMFSQSLKEETFPELKESEDERIELLNYLYDVHDDDEERARWIAWLERQGKLITELQKTYAEIGRLVKENYYLKERQGEQIDCLYDAVARYNREGFSAATLMSLLEQLKKLKEE